MDNINFQGAANNQPTSEETTDNDPLSILIRWKARYGLTEEQCLEIAEDLQGSSDNHSRNEFWKIRNLIERGFITLRAYVRKGGDSDMAERVLWLWLGFPVLAGADSLAGIVKTTGKSKATVNKCIQHFQKLMPELPPLPGQRDEESRENMKQARIEQLTESSQEEQE